MANVGQRLVLAFDFGTRRIGVAVGNELVASARELTPLMARDGIPDWQRVAALVDEWRPDLFVVGLPLELDGAELEMCVRARKFGKRLFGRFGVPCEMVDERGTTREAKTIARQRGHRGNYRDDGVDGIAAVLILESWFATCEGLPRNI
ncbi:Holliday junction resolvase RuvX [Halomonas urumqiensis]|uniref:Putative pre-16S rRNA nuclease n=1 Tax=Halomonas urumqiensis TaxID=1684789 RepID=A0A2N7UK86_9GAMM|nr:Holliday junction resolvase RuvX [Halomonas urumqiensis]PMR80835.1 Holliday junction resolvase RuvX [Halomonas urumqiensis]PTB02792.1 Holliday junction resolvase RuvX [Halomonas urumqiensis]GHE21296.1 putative pre-16S rRNA nuclease [Halomonas urumqiensis]